MRDNAIGWNLFSWLDEDGVPDFQIVNGDRFNISTIYPISRGGLKV